VTADGFGQSVAAAEKVDGAGLAEVLAKMAVLGRTSAGKLL